ncbi:hypothetical protein Agub_g11221 [Astrephomene gubernaculifera]|uniref:Uncharacterized protein n=1 Tax=Astrephomene gubernaculifera TaxID=47775 RepID=A0AAD3DW95_9CHLO|nr:hypothetical protein Agub_g11221 [Astrephomene gubernaculifera]
MSLPAIFERISDALRGKEGKLPEIFHILADSKSTQNAEETWLAAARAALKNGEHEQCKGILEAFLEQDPHNTSANLLLSRACQQLGTVEALEESVAVARSALAQASTPEDCLRAAVQLAVSLGSRARVHTRQQVERQKDRTEALQLLSSVLDLNPASSTSITTTATAPQAAPDASAPGPATTAHALYVLALLQAEQGAAGQAGQAALGSARAALAAAQAAGQAQLTALSLVLVAALLSSRCQHKLALSVLSAAPTSASAASSSTPSTPVAGPGPASAAPAPSATSPSSPTALWSDVWVWRLRARLLAAQSDTAGSLAALAAAKKLLSGWLCSSSSSSSSAQPDRREGSPTVAPSSSHSPPAGVTRTEVEEALASVWCELATSLAASGQAGEALAAADHALALRPWAAAVRHALGAVHEALGRYDEAAAAYGEALALDPSHAPSLLRQGALQARRGGRLDLALARDTLTEALRYEPASAAAWFQLGRVAAALQHRQEAEGHMLTAVQLASTAPVMEYGELPLAPPHAE